MEFFAEWSLCPDNVAFLRVQTGMTRSPLSLRSRSTPFTGVYDPALIGDKPKWYSRNLTSIPFNIIEENSTLGQALSSFNAGELHQVERSPTGERVLHVRLTFLFVSRLQTRAAAIPTRKIPVRIIRR